ncbi:MAG: TIGR03905 family TSCPD domain-containing protein [Clostridiales bacterium]|nr:TIGR03905 family TSCPD domain-containing protein [Clostridiales bacterium]MCD7827410.1 TIGR03905 family TSCPD domain-containing protein [Clostridiales bacterium]
MNFSYKTRGTCSTKITFDLDDGVVSNVRFVGGCNGNLKGIGSLVEGMNAEDVVKKLKGTTCGFKGTSCPDQLAAAIEEALRENEK